MIDVALPNTTAGRDAAENVRQGVLTGLSVEFRSEAEGKRGPLREIRRALLGAAGLVDTASYKASTVEVQGRAGHYAPLECLYMAVTFSAVDLAAALRLGDSAEELAEVTRLLDYVSESVTQHAPKAPDVAHTEAARRLAGYLYNQPESSRGEGYSNAHTQ